MIPAAETDVMKTSFPARQTSPGTVGSPLHLWVFALVAILWLPNLALGQAAATFAPTKAGDPVDTSHAERCLAAIDLAIVAAESGIVDVSIEAMRRAVRQGPPVANLKLGGLLSSQPPSSVGLSSNNAQPSEAETAQTRLAQRLYHLNEVWVERKVDPAQAYEAFKALVLPQERPQEAFAYSVAVTNRQSYSYSDIDFDFAKPKIVDCGAAALVQWAKLAGREDELRREIAKREPFTGAASTALLLKVILAQNESRPAADAEALCEALAATPKVLVDAPDAVLLSGYAWQMLDRVSPDSSALKKLVDAILSATEREPNWVANDWLHYLVSKGLRESIDQGDGAQFSRYASLAIARYNPIRANNADYVASREAALYGEAAKRAFKAGQLKLAVQCLRSQGLIFTTEDYLQIQAEGLLDPTEAVADALLKMERSERYELFNDLVWNMPELGLRRCARMNATDFTPQSFLTSLRGPNPPAVPWRQVVAENGRSVSLLEWTMRDAIALGKQSTILEHIAKLEAAGSDNARLARIVFGLAQDKPADLALLAKTADDQTVTLTPTMGESGYVTPLDMTVVEQALDREDYRSAGVKLRDQLFAMAVEHHQDLFVTLLRNLKFRSEATADKPVTSQDELVHWVVSDDVKQYHLALGHVPATLWIRRDDNSWGHEFGTDFSILMFRYPLAGDLSISFRSKDGVYVEGGTTLDGRMIEFLEYRNSLQISGIGLRNTTSIETDVMESDQFNAIRLDRKNGSLTIHVGKGFEKELDVPAGDFPFFGMCAYQYRATTFDSLKIEGNVTIPRSVDMLTPSLLGWSARFKEQLLPRFTVLPEDAPPAAKKSDKVEYDWHLVDGALESVDHEIEKKQSDASATPDERRPREGLVRYLRPLYGSEQISLEFYHEPGKLSLAPALGRIALLLDESKVALHWITSDPTGNTTGFDETNRIVDDRVEQLKPIALKNNDWNQMTLRLEGETVTLSLNGEDVYRRVWEAEAGRQFGLFHDPTQYHVRARNMQLSGDWPETLPADLFELKPNKTLRSAR